MFRLHRRLAHLKNFSVASFYAPRRRRLEFLQFFLHNFFDGAGPLLVEFGVGDLEGAAGGYSDIQDLLSVTHFRRVCVRYRCFAVVQLGLTYR